MCAETCLFPNDRCEAENDPLAIPEGLTGRTRFRGVLSPIDLLALFALLALALAS